MNNIHLKNQIFFAYEAVKKKETLENEIQQKRQAVFNFIKSKQTPKQLLRLALVSFGINTGIIILFGVTINKSLVSEEQGLFNYILSCYNPFSDILIFLISWGVCITIFVRLCFHFWKFNIDEYYSNYKDTAEVKKLETEISEINNKITILVHSPEYISDTKIFAECYHNTAWIVTIFNLIKNGRADTIKEALNIAEQELKMQQLQQQNRQMQQAMNEAIYQAQIAAINSEDASAMARINFYDRF